MLSTKAQSQTPFQMAPQSVPQEKIGVARSQDLEDLLEKAQALALQGQVDQAIQIYNEASQAMVAAHGASHILTVEPQLRGIELALLMGGDESCLDGLWRLKMRLRAFEEGVGDPGQNSVTEARIEDLIARSLLMGFPGEEVKELTKDDQAWIWMMQAAVTRINHLSSGRQSHDVPEMALDASNMGHFHLHQGNTRLAAEELRRATRFFKENGDKPQWLLEQAKAANSLTYAYCELREYHNAVEANEEAQRILDGFFGDSHPIRAEYMKNTARINAQEASRTRRAAA